MSPTCSKVGILFQIQQWLLIQTHSPVGDVHAAVQAAAVWDTQSEEEAQLHDAARKLRESCASYVAAPTGGTTYTFHHRWWIITSKNEVSVSISHDRGPTLTRPLSTWRPLTALFKDGQWFPSRWLCNVALICSLSALGRRRGLETRRRSWRRQGELLCGGEMTINIRI